MYYKIYSDTSGEQNVYIHAVNNPDCLLDDGDIIDVDEEELELPYEFLMKVRKNEDGSRQTPNMYAYDPSGELMHKDLIQALRDNGVDNLQTFPAVVREDGQTQVIDTYEVVNVIGLVACANNDKASSVPLADGEYFTDLVIDPAKTMGLLLFRLAESQMDILVHERVAKKLMSMDFPGLVLTPVKES